MMGAMLDGPGDHPTAGMVLCPACGGGPFVNSYNGWQDHTSGPHHSLVLMGLRPDEADAVIAKVIEAGASFEATMAALRYALTTPPERLAEMAAALRAFAR